MNTLELEAGPELDAAVAKAVGLAAVVVDGRAFVHAGEHNAWLNPNNERTTEGVATLHWSPSTDLNAAFEAAEKCGLFESGNFALYCSRHAGWFFVPLPCDPSDYAGSRGAPTPALAICRAILKLKGTPPPVDSAPGSDVS